MRQLLATLLLAVGLVVTAPASAFAQPNSPAAVDTSSPAAVDTNITGPGGYDVAGHVDTDKRHDANHVK